MKKLIRPYIFFEEVEKEFKEIFDSGMLTSSVYSKLFPQKLCEYTGAKYAFNATSCTTALAIALETLNIGQGDEVIVSDFSFPATANVVEQRGATTVFADVDRSTYNMTVETLEQCVTAKTKAVIFVCALGNPTGLHEIKEFCHDQNIPLIADAACAIGSSENSVKVGNIADMSCFSFHPRKLVTAGEGGAVTTSNKGYADILAVKSLHGAVAGENGLDFITYGYNNRLPELQCLMLIKQLEKLDSIVKERINTQNIYREQLEPFGMLPQTCGENVVHNMQSIAFTVPQGVNRNKMIEYLKSEEIETTKGTYCQSNCTYYRNKYNSIQKNALWLDENSICLPCYHGLDEEYVIEKVKAFCTNRNY